MSSTASGGFERQDTLILGQDRVRASVTDLRGRIRYCSDSFQDSAMIWKIAACLVLVLTSAFLGREG